MKSYKLEIEIGDDGRIGVHEYTDKGLTTVDARLITSVLEEYKIRLLNYIIVMQQEIDLKNKPKND